MNEITLSAASLEALLVRDGWRERKALRELLGPGITLAFHAMPGFAYLTLDASVRFPGLRPVLRSVVVLRPEGAIPAIVTFDLVGGRVKWSVEGDSSRLFHQAIRPRSGEVPELEHAFVNVFARGDNRVVAAEVEGPDLAGTQAGNSVVLFHTEALAARFPLSFEVSGREDLKILITGLSPGVWEVWRNGWLEDYDGVVRPGESTIHFEGPPGHYFVRRL